MHGEGDILIHLTTMGYKLNYQQVSGFAVLLAVPNSLFLCFWLYKFLSGMVLFKFCLNIVRLY